ncbi:transcription factor EC-like [Oenanthe melanoleuca]|uniref:transcription factor EC-like n=1 Tax=Oenanthe melanoleuca TaxID=2939378 RepID=UPI0024C10253|nr:transcription factor EC-like [Oenanthe melanoleuca]
MAPASSAGPGDSPVPKLLALGAEREHAMEEVIEDIINMESNFNDEGIGCSETPLLMQRTGFKLHTNKGELHPDEGRRIFTGFDNLPSLLKIIKCLIFIALWRNISS